MPQFKVLPYLRDQCFNCKIACKRKVPIAAWHSGALLTILVFVFASPTHADCNGTSLNNTKHIEIGKVIDGSEKCDYRMVTYLDINECRQDKSDYRLFEFWLLNGTGAGSILFLVARGTQPKASLQASTTVVLSPKPADPQLGQNGTWLDSEGIRNDRAHQRILVPANATTSGLQDWFITVADLYPRSKSSMAPSYQFRVTCVQPGLELCPRPAPDKDPCGGPKFGTCVAPPAEVPRPALNPVCRCNTSYGDVDCQTPAPALSNGEVVSKLLQPEEWAFWQVSVPMPSSKATAAATSNSKRILLVEMSRGDGFATDDAPIPGGSGSAVGSGDPMLFVMPKDKNGTNRVPYLYDFMPYADVSSVRLQQNLHFKLLELDYMALSPTDNSSIRTLEFYVAVYNNNPNNGRRFSGTRQINGTANVTLRVRWRTGGEGSNLAGGGDAIGPLCPNDCYGKSRGTCISLPLDSSPTANVGSFGPIPPRTDFRCICNEGFGGPLCEGTLRNLTLSTSPDATSGTLAPGQWAFFVITISPSTFDVNFDDLGVLWAVKDANNTYDDPNNYTNALFTLNFMAFPRFPSDESSQYGLERGSLISYDYLLNKSKDWQPIYFRGNSFKSNSSYVLGLYNSDYSRQGTYNYTFGVFIPSQSRSWLQPYMSVVLGISASVVLCFLMASCRGLLQRYGWGPFRSRQPGGDNPDGNMLRAQMPPRPHGVPPQVIDTFYSYQYQATRAEKVQLAKSRRESQIPAPPPPILPTTSGSRCDGCVIELGQLGAPPLRAAAAAALEVAATPAAMATAVTGSNQFHVTVSALAEPTNATALEQSTRAADGANNVGGSGAASNGSAAPFSDEDDEPQCAVCLCEYEEGEVITQLPCKHEFHGKCIRKWLQTHYTCPICRVSLVPNQAEALELPPGAANGDAQPLAITNTTNSMTTNNTTTSNAPPRQQQPLLQELPIQQQDIMPPHPPGQIWATIPLAGNGSEAATRAEVHTAGGPTVLVPVSTTATATAAETDPPARSGFLSRVMGSMRRSPSPRREVLLQPIDRLLPSDRPWATAPPGAEVLYEGHTTILEPGPATLVVANPVWAADSNGAALPQLSGSQELLAPLPPWQWSSSRGSGATATTAFAAVTAATSGPGRIIPDVPVRQPPTAT